ncbi:MAG: PIG-L family deacetylase, partial [Actinomycetia bacterium]|nr:PIG-L family deacetylase [Actinomycetes bacterium]
MTVRHNRSTMRNLLFLHAHPDDEALLTAGTMAKAEAAGHRVHLLVATDGAAGLSSTDFQVDLASHRSAELAKSAQILGVSSVTELGYPDSGLNGEHNSAGGFAGIDVSLVANRIELIIDELSIDTIIGYDPSGGYGHPDHIAIHNV